MDRHYTGVFKSLGVSSDKVSLVYVDFKHFGHYSPPRSPYFQKLVLKGSRIMTLLLPQIGNQRLGPIDSFRFFFFFFGIKILSLLKYILK